MHSRSNLFSVALAIIVGLSFVGLGGLSAPAGAVEPLVVSTWVVTGETPSTMPSASVSRHQRGFRSNTR